MWRDHPVSVVLMVMTLVFAATQGGSAGLTLIVTVAVGLSLGVVLRRWLPVVRPTPWPEHPYRQRRASWPSTVASRDGLAAQSGDGDQTRQHSREPGRRPTLRQFRVMLVIAVPAGVAEWWVIDAAGLDSLLPLLPGINMAGLSLGRASWRFIGERRAGGESAPVADDGERR